MQKITYIYIACCGHSGSTLLELLLGSHPQSIAVGEIRHFANYYEELEQHCGCGNRLSECNFWQTILNRLPITREQSLVTAFPTDGIRSQWLPGIYGGILLWFPILFQVWSQIPNSLAQRNLARLNNHWRLISIIAETTGCQVIVDSSMSPSGIIELAYTAPSNICFKVVHLTRDGRGNALSHMANFGITLQQAAITWKRINRHILFALTTLPKEHKYQLQYEKLCNDPTATLHDLCQFIGVNYDPVMLHFRTRVQHGIGGNPMRFRKHEETIVVDERWKSALDNQSLYLFDRVAGRMNQQLGYR